MNESVRRLTQNEFDLFWGHFKLFHRRISAHPNYIDGLEWWQLDQSWILAINGSNEAQSLPFMVDVKIEPKRILVFCNDMPYLMAGELAGNIMLRQLVLHPLDELFHKLQLFLFDPGF